MNLTSNSKLTLVPIEIRKDKKHYIVEECISGEFYEMSEVCVDAINLIQSGTNLGEIEGILKKKYPYEIVNLLDFAKQLLDLSLVAQVDGIGVEKRPEKKENQGFLWISPKLGKLFFNRVALVLYVFLFIMNIILLTFYPGLFPHYKDIFIFKYMFLNIPIWLVLTSILVLIHEFGHILAIRAHNLSTKIEFGHRMFLVVLETDMSFAWKLSSRERNVLYLAGLCFDTVILFLSIAGLIIFSKSAGIILSLMHVIVLVTFIRMLYQCCIYMKTDLYFVFENVTGCYNLIENARQVIRERLFFRSALNRKEIVFSEEKNTIFLYSIFYFIGVSLTVFLYFGFYIPQLLFSIKKVIPGFGKSPASFAFWDSSLFMLQIVLGMFMLLSSWKKKYLASKAK